MLLFGGKDTKILRYHQIIVDKNIATSLFGGVGVIFFFHKACERKMLGGKDISPYLCSSFILKYEKNNYFDPHVVCVCNRCTSTCRDV